VPIIIQRGIVQATAILSPTPSITGDAQLAGPQQRHPFRRARAGPDRLSRRPRPGAAARRGPPRRALPGRRQCGAGP
jgi:hypothetical protein